MRGPRFLGIELRFGRHGGRFELPGGGPVVIAGPNGSGKTTLVDALFRTVLGFRRQRPGDRELLESRRPWTGGGCEARVSVESAEGERLEWSRDFDTDFVTVTRDDGEILYEGEARAGGKGSKAEEYARLVKSVFGLDDLDDYQRTTWIAQGTLHETGFDAGLLTLVEGGHASVESALAGISEAHKELTVEPVREGGRALNKRRLLELRLADLENCRSRLTEARSRERSRGPTLQRLSAIDGEEADLAERIRVLDMAHDTLLELQAASAKADLARRQLDAVVELRDAMERARTEEVAAENDLAVRVELGEYPSDFGIRASHLKDAWSRLEGSTSAGTETRSPGRAAAWAASAFVVLGALLEVFGLPGGPYAALLGILLGIAYALVAFRRGRRTETRAGTEEGLRREIRAILEGVPDADTLLPETLPDRLESFERQESARKRLAYAQARLEEVERRAEQLATAVGSEGRSLALLESDAGRTLGDCEDRVRDLESVLPPQLPDGLRRVPADVKGALDSLRQEATRLADERRQLEVHLAGTAQVSGVEAIEDECEALESQIDDLRRSVAAHRAAFALVEDGYAEFREQDEARLVAAVAARIGDLGGEAFGGFRAGEGLEDPTVEIGSRQVGFESSQLSHGQRLVVKLAMRIGTADFLATGSVAAPLVVDDPFAHLDDDNAARVWSLLTRVADTRQVIVTTQETELLARLGVTDGVVQFG